jgi:hypothetical protein
VTKSVLASSHSARVCRLRHSVYDELGVLVPARVDEASGYSRVAPFSCSRGRQVHVGEAGERRRVGLTGTDTP